MEQKPIYLGSLKPVGKDGLKGRVYLTDQSIVEVDDKGRKFIPIIIWKKKEPSDWGHTHSLQFDSWKPEQQEQEAPKVKKDKKIAVDKLSDDDLPF